MRHEKLFDYFMAYSSILTKLVVNCDNWTEAVWTSQWQRDKRLLNLEREGLPATAVYTSDHWWPAGRVEQRDEVNNPLTLCKVRSQFLVGQPIGASVEFPWSSLSSLSGRLYLCCIHLHRPAFAGGRHPERQAATKPLLLWMRLEKLFYYFMAYSSILMN